MKELELEDRQYEIDKELNELGQIPRMYTNVVQGVQLAVVKLPFSTSMSTRVTS